MHALSDIECDNTPSSSTTILDVNNTKRKRKVPLKHRDFSSVILKDEDSDQDIDEILFKRAKIEYTNVDGSKAGVYYKYNF